jgi:outer membrane protein assembly factor BamB
MKKVVKLNQKDIEKIVNNVINENQGELDEYLMLGGNQNVGTKNVYVGKDDAGNYYILDAETGKILAKDNPNKSVADDNLPMAAE